MPLAPAVSGLARQTMKTAFEELDKAIAPADSSTFANTTLQDVQRECLDIENQLAARQSLRNMRRLMPLFKGLEHYSKVIEVLCNGTPYLPWLWAPMSVILRTASEYVEAFEQLIKGYSRIAATLGRFETLGLAFKRDLNFQQTITVFYSDILQFHKHAYNFVRRSGWRLLFLTSWGRFQRRFDSILEDMKYHERLVDLEANARNIAEAKKMREEIRAWREDDLQQVSLEETEQTAKYYNSIASWLKIDESDQIAIFDSISAEGSKYPGTCGWILKNSHVSAWSQKKTNTPFLWLQGTLGSGKSVICSQLINLMKMGKLFVAYHFCTYLYSSSLSYENILRSLLLQLLRHNGELVAHVHKTLVLERKVPNISTLEDLLQMLLSNASNEPSRSEYVWIVVDGLHECAEDKQKRLISLFDNIVSKLSKNGATICKVLVSSRKSPTLSKRSQMKQVISLSNEKRCLEDAIRAYASQRLVLLQDKFHQLEATPNEIKEIERAIALKADGMFLYARLVLDYLASNIFLTIDEVKSSVSQLPEKLSDFYQKILTQILVQLDPRSVKRMKCIFGWVAFAKRPLRKVEFLSAISFSAGDPGISQLAPPYILDHCSSIVEQRNDTTLTFIHVSLKEYLQSSKSNIVIEEQEALVEHGIATITCLLSGLDVFSTTYDDHAKHLRVVKGLHGLHVYATEYWTEYVLSIAATSDGLEASSELFNLSLQLTHQLDHSGWSHSEESTPLEIAALDGRLSALHQYPSLRKHLVEALRARSLGTLESSLCEEDVCKGPRKSKHDQTPGYAISAMLSSYQEIVQTLLTSDSYTGISTDKLQAFKKNFQTSAFTCRLSSCPRATLGFESSNLLQEHELTHVKKFPCTFVSCQYPPFVTARALRSHIKRQHSPSVARKTIRKFSPENLNRQFAASLDNSRELVETKNGVESLEKASVTLDITIPLQSTEAISDTYIKRSDTPGVIGRHMQEYYDCEALGKTLRMPWHEKVSSANRIAVATTLTEMQSAVLGPYGEFLLADILKATRRELSAYHYSPSLGDYLASCGIAELPENDSSPTLGITNGEGEFTREVPSVNEAKPTEVSSGLNLNWEWFASLTLPESREPSSPLFDHWFLDSLQMDMSISSGFEDIFKDEWYMPWRPSPTETFQPQGVSPQHNTSNETRVSQEHVDENIKRASLISARSRVIELRAEIDGYSFTSANKNLTSINAAEAKQMFHIIKKYIGAAFTDGEEMLQLKRPIPHSRHDINSIEETLDKLYIFVKKARGEDSLVDHDS